MPDKATPTPSRQQVRTVHNLTARDLVVGPKHKQPKPRRKTIKTLIKEAKDAGLDPKRLCPDGSVEVGAPDPLPAANGHDDHADEWDKWMEARHEH